MNTSFPGNERRGNTVGNLVNKGYIARQDDWVYYVNWSDDNKIYKMRDDLSENQQLNWEGSANLNVVDDWIYYISYGEDGRICKIRTDGTKHTVLNDHKSASLSVAGEWVYYANKDKDGCACRMRTDGSEKQRINSDNSWNLYAADGWVYYGNRDDGDRIYKIRTDGTGRMRLNDDKSWSINADGEWLYYCNKDDGDRLYRVRSDGSDCTPLNDDLSWYVNLNGQWLYYLNRSDNGRLYKIQTDGTERTRITQETGYTINVAGDWAYYSDFFRGTGFCRSRTDGTGRQQLQTMNVPEIITVTEIPADKTPVRDKSPSDTGNSPGNIANGGLAAWQGEWMYYHNRADSGKLYKIRTDGTGCTRLTDDTQVDLINVLDDWVYYRAESLFRVRTDGTSRQWLLDKMPEELMVRGGWIYYTPREERCRLHKMRTDGSDITRLNGDYTCSINLTEDWIYYSCASDNHKLYKIRPDGTERTRLNHDTSMSACLEDGWLYYRNYSGYRFRVKPDGTGRQLLGQGLSAANVYGGWIYYIDWKTNHLYRQDTDGSLKMRLLTACCDKPHVSGDRIYYLNKNEKRFECLRTDGSASWAVDQVDQHSPEPVMVTEAMLRQTGLARQLMSGLPDTQVESDRYWKIRDYFCLTKVYSGGWDDPDRDEKIHEYLDIPFILAMLHQVTDNEMDEREAVSWLEEILAKADSCRDSLWDEPYYDEDMDPEEEELTEAEEAEEPAGDEDEETTEELSALRSDLAEILLEYAFEPIWDAIRHIHETVLQALDTCTTPEERLLVLRDQWAACYTLEDTVINGTAAMFDEFIFDKGGHATFEDIAAGIYSLADSVSISQLHDLIRETDFQVNEVFWEKLPTLNLYRFPPDAGEMSAEQAAGIAEALTDAIRQVSGERTGMCQADELDGNLAMDVSLSICRFMLNQLKQIC